MWEVFEELCRLRGVSVAEVSKETKIAQSTLSNWKKRRNILNPKALRAIAEYFNVPVSFLMTGEGEVELHVPAEQVAKEVAEMLHANPVLLDMLYDFRDITESWEQRLKGYYDALRNYERRKEST